MLRIIVKAQLLADELKSAVNGYFKILQDDDSGASLMEYSVLLGIILALSIALIVFAGQWANAQWNSLVDALSGNGAPL